MKQRPIATADTRRNLYLNLEKHYIEQAEKTTDPAAKQVWLNRAAEAKRNADSPMQ